MRRHPLARHRGRMDTGHDHDQQRDADRDRDDDDEGAQRDAAPEEHEVQPPRLGERLARYLRDAGWNF